MKACLTKTILLISVLLLTACGGGKWETEYRFPGFEYTQSLEMILADNGQIYVVGIATNTDPQLRTFFVAAFSRNGNLLWDKALASVNESRYVQFGESVMTVDSQNNLYVALGSDTLPLQVYKLSSGGELVDSWYPPVVLGAGSNDIEVGPDNRLYLFSSRAIFVYSLEGDLIWNSADNGFEPNYHGPSLVYHYKPNARNNIRFMDNGNILFFDRTMILVYDANGELLNSTASSDVGMTEIEGAEILADTIFITGNGPFLEDFAPMDSQGLISLTQDLTYKDKLIGGDSEALEIDVSADRLCFGITAYNTRAELWTNMAYYDAELNALAHGNTYYYDEFKSRRKQKVVGAPSGCYYAEIEGYRNENSRVVRFDDNGDLTELSRFEHNRIADFIVQNSALILVGNIMNDDEESVEIKLARQPE